MPLHGSSSKPLPENIDPSEYPLIRDILKNYSPYSSTDNSAWLSDPAISDAVRRAMPIGYMSQDKILLDTSGQLLVWGDAKATWKHCLKIEGLKWATSKTDLLDLFKGHDVIDPPIILGTTENFTALVYMGSLKGCEDAITDLNGAEIEKETTLRVTFATNADLQKALEIQGHTFNNMP